MRRTIAEVVAEARSKLERMEPRRAFEAMSEGCLLIDTRSGDHIEREGVIPGALHLPLSVLEWRVDPDSQWRDERVEADAKLILICRQGYASSLAAVRLQELGFDATDVIGGFEAWAAAGLPVQPTDEWPPDNRSA